MISELKISRHDIKLIEKEFKANEPYEACGILIGTKNNHVAIVEKAVPITNVRRSLSSFELDPKEHYIAWNEADKNGKEVVGVYHTHPNFSAVPSTWDRKTMENAPSIWLIAGYDGIGAYIWNTNINNIQMISIVLFEENELSKH